MFRKKFFPSSTQITNVTYCVVSIQLIMENQELNNALSCLNLVTVSAKILVKQTRTYFLISSARLQTDSTDEREWYAWANGVIKLRVDRHFKIRVKPKGIEGDVAWALVILQYNLKFEISSWNKQLKELNNSHSAAVNRLFNRVRDLLDSISILYISKVLSFKLETIVHWTMQLAGGRSNVHFYMK